MPEFFGDNVKDISSLIQENLLAITKRIGRIFISGMLGALIAAIAGLIISLVFYYLYNQIWSFAQSTSALGGYYLLILIYMIIIGLLFGTIIGLFRGLKKGTKKMLLKNEFVNKLIKNIVTHAIEQAENAKEGTGSLAIKAKPYFLSWKQNLNIHIEKSPKVKNTISLLFKFTSSIKGIFFDKINKSIDYMTSEVTNLNLENTNKDETIDQLTKYCQNKTDALLEISINQTFQKPLIFSYIIAIILLFLPILIFVIF